MAGATMSGVEPGMQIARIEAAVDDWWEADRGGTAQQVAYERLVGVIALSPHVAGGREDLATIADTFISMRVPPDQQRPATDVPADPPPDDPPRPRQA